MNKILLVALAAIALFMGCSKKNNPSPSASLEGKWYITTDTAKVYTNNVLTQQDPESFDHSDYVQFNSNGTGIQLSGDASSNFTYSVKGNSVTLNYPKQTIDNTTIDAFSKTATFKATSSALYIYIEDTETDGSTTYRYTEATYFTNK
ncbi:hypothetical protein SAMN05216490_0920 [Mucilaginibacter mallensis]|uniref:Lipocalin-like domain-containing protein n=1 Tax=Mucilaginibacter mallensis TaxID=652787 RepID=A0A1H1R542_MUCMA|nr:lipocalin family protein [Mucilaginibacter mallensis]SDS30828.1 hypothetical protein SAMN05216490_0920 [Mucilaginibacter mallensis]